MMGSSPSSEPLLPSHILPRLYLYWVCRSVPPYTGICANVLREVCEYLKEFAVLACIHGTSVWHFSFKTEEWEARHHLKTSLSISMLQTTVVSLGGCSLFLCRPANNSCETFIVDEEKAVQQPANSVSRRAPGLFYSYRLRCVYLFGGGTEQVDRILASSEAFGLSRRVWRTQGEMCEPRHSFTPCEHQNLVYLVGGCFTSSVETFDQDSGVFTLTAILLPESHATLAAVCYPHDLVVVTSHSVSTWNLKTLTEENRHKREYSETVDSCLPTLRNGGFYYVQGKTCVRIDLQRYVVQYELVLRR